MVEIWKEDFTEKFVNDDSAKLVIPDTEKIDLFCEAIRAKYTVLYALVWGAMGGLKLNVQESIKN